MGRRLHSEEVTDMGFTQLPASRVYHSSGFLTFLKPWNSSFKCQHLMAALSIKQP